MVENFCSLLSQGHVLKEFWLLGKGKTEDQLKPDQYKIRGDMYEALSKNFI